MPEVDLQYFQIWHTRGSVSRVVREAALLHFICVGRIVARASYDLEASFQVNHLRKCACGRLLTQVVSLICHEVALLPMLPSELHRNA